MLNKISKIIDCHSHVLPKMDDGSKSREISIEMLKKAYEDGTREMVLTSHFYPNKESIDSFLKRRDESLKLLMSDIDEVNIPKISLGAEVFYFYGISQARSIRELCYTGSDFLLIEMPFSRWNKADIEEIENLIISQNVIPIIAHFERFLDFGNLKFIKMLKRMGCLIQTNSEFIIDKNTQKAALKFFKKGLIDLIGTDAHNMDKRPINLKTSIEILSTNLKDDVKYRILDANAFIRNNIKHIN